MRSFLVLFCLCLQKNDANVFTSDEETRIKSYINTMLECKQVTGLNLAATKNEDTFSDGFGLSNVLNSAPVTRNTIMSIGSITKSLTSIVWSAFISDAKTKGHSNLDWDTKVGDIFGKSFQLNSDCLTDLVTLEDFLSHRTGLESADITLEAGVPERITRDDLMKNIKYLQSKYEFREKWSYCNTGYVMVGYLLEKVAQKSWEQTMREMLFIPLNMTSTTFLTDKTFSSMATPYKYIKGKGKIEPDRRVVANLNQYGPAGSIISTAEDMSKVMKWLTSGEYTTLGINKDVFDRLFEQKTFMPPRRRQRYSVPYNVPSSVDTYGYGNGWMLSTFRGLDMYFHTGGWHGFYSIMAFIPSKNISVFLNSNGIGESGFPNIMMPTTFYLLDTLLGIDPWLNETTACTYPSPWKQINKEDNKTNDTDTHQVNVDNAERFIGMYSNPFYGDFNVIEVNKTLTIKYGLLLTGTLSYKSNYEFILIVKGLLADLADSDMRVAFENFTNNVFMSVRLDKYAVFGRTTTNTATQFDKQFVFYLVIIFIVYLIH